MMTRHIGINGTLLALGESYRSAGISRYIYHLTRALPRVSEDRYTMWSAERGGEMAGIERRVAPDLTRRPTGRILWEQAALPLALRRAGVDLFHSPAFVLPVALPVPGVMTVHDLSFLTMPEAFRPFNRHYLSVMTRLSARRAAHVCTVSEHAREEVIRLLGVPREKTTVVYNGLSPQFETVPSAAEVATFRQRQGLPERFVLYLGTLEPRKNVPLLMRAFARIAPHFPGVPLVLAGGKGWGYDEIFAEAEALALGDQLRFAGYVPDEALPLWYAAATMLAYPSRYEGFGLPPLEAMAMGTPTITTEGTSLDEVVGDAGTRVPPGNEAALAEAMATLLEDDALREERSARGRERARGFRWEESARVQAALYRRLLAG